MKRKNKGKGPSAKQFKGTPLTEEVAPQFLEGIKCHVHPAHFGLKRRGLLEGHVTRYGGELVSSLPETSDETYHVVFEENVDEEKVKRLVDISKFPNCVFLSCMWLIESIKEKKRANGESHLLVPLKCTQNVRSDEKLREDEELHSPNIEIPEKSWSSEINRIEIKEEDWRGRRETHVKETDSQNNKNDSEINENSVVKDLAFTGELNPNECKKDPEGCTSTTIGTRESEIDKEKKLQDYNDEDELNNRWRTKFGGEENLQSLIRPFPKNLQEKFVCARPSSSKPVDLNADITSELEKLAKAYKSKNDTWRAVGYERAIAAIRNYGKKITSREEALGLPGIGGRLADKIVEILESGRLRKVAEVCDGEEAETLRLFLGVWGAGPTTAQAWYLQDFRTLEDLRTKATLNRHQQIGLKHYHDINSRIPRSEVEEIENHVREAACSIVKGAEVMVCGSYRRGKETCGDVDVLITHPDGDSHNLIFRPLLAQLKATGFLTDDLVTQEDNGNQKKYLGVCKLPGDERKHRRLDVIVVPYSERSTAIMYFTGSAHFNRSMRLLATKKGMSLSEHNLKAGVMRQGGEKLNEGCILETPTEESIFAHLGLEYRPPQERDH